MVYSRNEMKSPVMTGSMLRTTARLLETRGVRRTLGWKVLKDAGIYVARSAKATDSPHVLSMNSGFEPSQGDLSELPPSTVGNGATSADLVAAYRDGSTTPEKVVERILSAIRPEAVFTSIDAASVCSEAIGSTERWKAGKPLSKLDGVPVILKESITLRGHASTCGTSFKNEIADEDSVLVARLRAAGAILLGKANMHEIGIGITGINPHHGTPRNPYDISRVTGGSSSGCAAAVGGGWVPIAVGTDGGGSIRIPAALCGTVGLKPTWSRVPGEGSPSDCWSVAHTGPIGATVRDCALLYSIIAGDVGASASGEGSLPGVRGFPQPAPDLTGVSEGNLSGLKVGLYTPWFEDADPEVVSACRAGVAALEAAGAEIIEVEIPELHLVNPVHLVTIVSEMAASQEEQLAKNPRIYGAETRVKLQLVRHLQPDDYVHAQRLRTRLCRHFDEALAQCDVIVTPTTSGTAPPIRKASLAHGEMDTEVTERMMRFMQIGNLTGYPCLTVPVGYDGDGLPIGLQLLGDAWQEALLFRMGAVVEANFDRRPPAQGISLL
jgi:Asp-tRNA(Asn)/Glu-tRNA(Gln) amidotransferase A subunit family amidase